MQAGEQIYYQLVVLHYPSFDFDTLKGENRTWKELFHHLLDTDATFRRQFIDEYLEQLFEQERVQEPQKTSTAYMIINLTPLFEFHSFRTVNITWDNYMGRQQAFDRRHY